jgi:MFS family permease
VVLTKLGDPARLAAGYADRPLHLIGPALFLDYVRLLRTLLIIVVPIVAVVSAVTQSWRGTAVLDLVREVTGATILTGVNLAFWVTRVFAVLERRSGIKQPLTGQWMPDRLPEPREHRPRFGELIVEAVGAVVVVAALALAPSLSPKRDVEGNPINVLDPSLWDSGIAYVFMGLVVSGLVASIASYYQGRWTPTPRTIVAALLEIAGPAVLIWIAVNDRILNPAFVEAMGWSADTVGVSRSVVIVVAVIGSSGRWPISPGACAPDHAAGPAWLTMLVDRRG